jgi:sterol desaturase/sphingolipid hydroxylase (fatty acid hydroxylase superfamily)
MEFGLEQKWVLGITAFLLILEVIVPRIKLHFFSGEFRENVFWFVLNKVVGLIFSGALIFFISSSIQRNLPFKPLDLTGVHWSLQFLTFFVLSDFISYGSHRFLHSQKLFWRFHQLHHSSKEITTSSAFRHHSFEDIYYALTLAFFTSYIAVAETPKLVIFIMINTACYFQHANIKMKFQEIWNLVFVTPMNHRWHHSTEVVKSHGQNFGLFLSVWDRMFGTYYVPEVEPASFGINDSYPEGLWERWIWPFYRK